MATRNSREEGLTVEYEDPDCKECAGAGEPLHGYDDCCWDDPFDDEEAANDH